MKLRCLIIGIALSALSAATLAAQVATTAPAADSASVARAAWRAALRADAAGDLGTAWNQVSRAASAWPEQPVYLEGLAHFAARRSDTTALVAALDRLRTIQAMQLVAEDSAIARMTAAPSVRAALSRLTGAVAPRIQSETWASLPDTTVYAEGIDADPATGTAFVASVRHRTIYQVAPGAAPRDLNVSRAPQVGAILGVRLDRARGVLWATTAGLPQMADYHDADSTIAALLQIRISDGTILARYDLDPREGHVAGDLAVSARGDVFVTDSRSPTAYHLRAGADSLVAFRHPLFRSLQGVAPAADGRTVYLADYSHGLLRWNVEAGTVIRLPVPPGTSALGVDGIILRRNSIFGIQNGIAPARVVRFDLDPTGDRIVAVEIIDRHQPLADEPTIATLSGNCLIYVANSQWEKYDDAGVRRAGTRLAPTVLLSLLLDR